MTYKTKLRALEPEDLDILYLIENNMEIWNVGVNNVPYSRYALLDYLSNASYDIYKDGQVRFVIENEEGHVVGIADVYNFEPRHNRAEVGIVVLDEYRRKGYACDAMTQLLSYAERVLHIYQLYAIVNVNNIPSQKLFANVGFELGGCMKDWLFDGHNYINACLYQFFCKK